jgi:hypothetical protein
LTRASEKASLSGLSLQAEFPANALVHFSLASSSDLVHWTPLALRGPLFRFEGENAPANHHAGAGAALPSQKAATCA